MATAETTASGLSGRRSGSRGVVLDGYHLHSRWEGRSAVGASEGSDCESGGEKLVENCGAEVPRSAGNGHCADWDGHGPWL